jgi:lauroyl/myristoyl acyltransferase
MRTKPRLSDYLEYGVYRSIEHIFRFMPVTLVDAFGSSLGRICWHLMKKRREIVERNCRVISEARLSQSELVSLSQSIFTTTGANLCSGVKMALIEDKNIGTYITVTGADRLNQQIEKSEIGVIFALVHMGNWEILARLNRLIVPKRPSAAFYRPLNNPLMNQLVKRRRTSTGTQLFSNKEGFTKAISHLRVGGMLGILADQNAGNTGIRIPFFGRNASCSPLIEILHNRTKAPVFYVSMQRTSSAHWHIDIREHSQEEMVDTVSVMRGIEKSLTTSLCDGFWFHNRWKINGKKPFLKNRNRKSQAPIEQKKPWQVVIILSQNTEIRNASIPAVTELVERESDFQFHIISCEETFTAANAKWHLVSKTTTPEDVMKSLDSSLSLAIDLIVFFTPKEELIHSVGNHSVTVVAGISDSKCKPLTLAIPKPSSALEDPRTWKHLIESLGSESSQ